MWEKIKNTVLLHQTQSIVLSLIVIVSIAGASYFVFQKGNSANNNTSNTEESAPSSTSSCSGKVKIGAVSVEKDPVGDPEAWIRFDYTAEKELNCQYTITFYDSGEEVIRTIPNVEDTFESPSGQIHNGYSSTPYQEGMTAKVTVN